MGAGPSREGIAPGAVKFGQLGEVGPLKGVALVRTVRSPSSTSTSSSSSSSSSTSTTGSAKTILPNGPEPVIVTVAKDFIDLYNAHTGDRKLRSKYAPSSSITCCDSHSHTVYGFILAVGTERGNVVLIDGFTLNEIKTIKPVLINTVSNLETTIVSKTRAGSTDNTNTVSTTNTTMISTGTSTSLNYVASCTAVTFLSNEILLVGYSDGVVRAFTVSSGACVRTYFVNSSESSSSSAASTSNSSSSSSPSTASSSSSSSSSSHHANVRIPFASSMLMKPLTVADLTSSSPSKLAMYSTSTPVVSQREVTCIAAYGIGSGTALSSVASVTTGTASTGTSSTDPPILLAVGRKDGTLDKFDLVTGQFLVSFKCGPGLTNLLPLRRFGCLASVHEDKNILTIWDIQADRTVQLDFTSELESTGRKLSKLSFATYDDYRGIIMTGDDTGSVYVRSVGRIAETNDLAVKLVRIAAPAPTASAPTRVTAMYYDTKVDVMFTGDASGLCRLVPKASSIPFKTLPEKDRNEVDQHRNNTMYTNLLSAPWTPRITEIQTLTLVQLKNAITALNLNRPSTLTYGLKKNTSPSSTTTATPSTHNHPSIDRLHSLKNSNNSTVLQTPVPSSSSSVSQHPAVTFSASSAVTTTSESVSFMSPTSPALPYPETPTTVKKAVLFTSPEETGTDKTSADNVSPSSSSSSSSDIVPSTLPEITQTTEGVDVIPLNATTSIKTPENESYKEDTVKSTLSPETIPSSSSSSTSPPLTAVTEISNDIPTVNDL